MQELRMPDINNVLIAGNLTKDPVFRRTTNGTPVTNFWIASNRRFRDNNGQWRENVCFVGVVAWYKLAENCAQNLRKGNAVIIEGELQSRSLRSEAGRNRSIVEIKARRIQFLNRRDESMSEIEAESIFDSEVEDGPSDDDNLEDIQEHDSQIFEEQIKKIEDENPNKGKFDFGYQDLKS
ncbi:MAG TPA: single-stranded DNA-binding protein [bacterium]|nr:single-stranded DNA-binding protein [bacterium]